MSRIPSSIINFESFREQRAEWRRFAKVLLLTLGAPLAVLLLLCELIAWKTGEFVPDGTSSERQTADPRTVWLAHREVDLAHFKLARLAQVRPEIATIGVSRLTQMRADMFKPYSFYNLAKISWPVETFPKILEHFPSDYSPKVIIFSLDHYMFNSLYGEGFKSGSPRFEPSAWTLHLDSLNDAFSTLARNPWVLFYRSPFPTIGLKASYLHAGYRSDGSEIWAGNVTKVAGRDPDMLAKFDWSLLKIYGGDAMQPAEETNLENFVQAAKARGIQLIGVQMPMYGPFVQALQRNGHFGIVQDFKAHFASGYFDHLGIIAFDFLEFPPDGSDYRYFSDPRHPGEVLDAEVLLRISQDARVKTILPKWDTSDLKRRLEGNRAVAQHLYLY